MSDRRQGLSTIAIAAGSGISVGENCLDRLLYIAACPTRIAYMCR